MEPRYLLVLPFALLAAACFSQPQRLLVSNYFGNSVAFWDSARPRGAITAQRLRGALGYAIGPDYSLYVCSELENEVLRFDLYSGRFRGVFAKDGLAHPTAICFHAGKAYIASFESSSIGEYDRRTGALLRVFVAPKSGGLDGPDVGTTFGPDGNLYVPSFNNDRILRFDGHTGEYLGDFVAAGSGGMRQPRTILWRPDGYIYVTSDIGNKVIRYEAGTGRFKDTFISAGSGGLDGASGMAFGNDGALYVTSWRNNLVLRFDGRTGKFLGIAADATGGTSGPTFVGLLDQPALRSIRTSRSTLRGGESCTAVITLSGKAVVGGSVVELSTDNQAVAVPGEVRIDGGRTRTLVKVYTACIDTRTTCRITARIGDRKQTCSLMVRPPKRAKHARSD